MSLVPSEVFPTFSEKDSSVVMPSNKLDIGLGSSDFSERNFFILTLPKPIFYLPTDPNLEGRLVQIYALSFLQVLLQALLRYHNIQTPLCV